jgi:hypothetical protein
VSERAGGERLGEAREVLQQHVAVGEHAEEEQPQLVAFADHRALDLVEDALREGAHLVQRHRCGHGGGD